MLKFILSVFPVQGVTALQLLLTKLGKTYLGKLSWQQLGLTPLRDLWHLNPYMEPRAFQLKMSENKGLNQTFGSYCQAKTMECKIEILHPIGCFSLRLSPKISVLSKQNQCSQ